MIRNILILALWFLSNAAHAQQLSISLNAKSAILYNPDTGAILYEKNAREGVYPASTMKIASVLYALEKEKNLSRVCIASEDALHIVPASEKHADFFRFPPHILEHDGVMLGLREGALYTMEDLLHGMLLYSGNDAANVLAEGLSGSVELFMKGFNAFLKEKGLLQTRFQNPHGLHHPAHMTTVYDMAKITGLAFQNEIFRKIIVTPSYFMNETWEIKNTNRFVRTEKFQYPNFIGGKTGYHSASGFNLIAAAEEDGRRLIAVLFGYENSTGPFEDAIRLFETAFQEKAEERKLFSKDPICFSREFDGQIVKAGLAEDVSIRVFPSEEMELEAKVHWHQLGGRVRVGDVLGDLVVSSSGGGELFIAPIYAADDAKKRGKKVLLFCSLALLLTFGFAVQARKVFKR